ncbi:arylamine N-acetyltransferase [Halorarum halophilum]|uniref:Arylamine N-acetyltransferase n=1 Tax=Halorarum halophilum TaxID=2743090 RepID=A0A7D5GC67_9EURY|nr:arylamine N-acetyltransferase [Halobaculum halophilum]QLG27945.1 arylamine N-acetyltransferase [Halobaculum halophilum]
MDADRYLARIGLDPTDVDRPSLAVAERLQRAHVTTVPFETLSVTGDPYDGADDGEGVTLALPHLYGKIVERERGGFCFELNGLFHTLLDALRFDVDRIAARMVGDDGAGRPPANHHTNVIDLDGRRYLVDVGMGVPTMRRPLPVDGEVRTDEVGYAWRVVESDRPDETYLTQYREPGDDDWQDRYLFSDVPRELSYFEATCDYLQSAPESPFTGDPVVSMATDEGHVKLRADSLTRIVDGNESEDSVAKEDWHDVLEREFGLRYRAN